MNTQDIFNYSGSLYKKSLEKYIDMLKKKIPEILKKDKLQHVHENISQIEMLREFQNEVDKITLTFNKQFPIEKVVKEELKPPKNRNQNTTHYTFETLDILQENEIEEQYLLKNIVYNQILDHLSIEDININQIFPQYMNWEINYYKTVSWLFENKLIEFNDYGYLKPSEKGEKFIGLDYIEDSLLQEINKDDQTIELNFGLAKIDSDADMMSAIRSFVLTNLINDGILEEEDSSYYNQFYLAKSIISIDGKKTVNWNDIIEDQYYKITMYSGKNEEIIFVRKKHNEYYVLETTRDNGWDAIFAFISFYE